MAKKIKASVITETIWMNENLAAQGHDLFEGIPDDLDRYIKAVDDALPILPVEDGVLKLEDLWLETSLPQELLVHILKVGDVSWPSNVERIRLSKKEYLRRKQEQEASQGETLKP